ncbi:MAG: HAMP domain-containing histidine kinase [Lentisphaeraceae bacterium]|nr:HAMP domain-containing histidine kinase [Lentisphaeraceae bacterium]
MIKEYMQSFSSNCHRALYSIFNIEPPIDDIITPAVTIGNSYTPRKNLIAHIPFYGPISGDFFVSVNEDEWKKAIQATLNTVGNDVITSSLKEFINISVGQTIPLIKKDFVDLNYSSPRIIRGQLEYPNGKTISSTITLPDLISVDITIAIDLMKTNISEKVLDQTLEKIKSTNTGSNENKLHNLLPLILERVNTQILDYSTSFNKLYNSEHDCTNLDLLQQKISYFQTTLSDIYDWTSSLKKTPDLFKISDSVVKALNSSLEFASQNIDITIHPPQREYIFAPQKAFEYILECLFKNAFEAMSETSKPKLNISFFQESAYSGIKIEDNGPGVPREKLNKIWQPFTTNKQQNNGLGLSICRDIAEIYGGDVLYSTSQMGGATFTLMLTNGEKQ